MDYLVVLKTSLFKALKMVNGTFKFKFAIL